MEIKSVAVIGAGLMGRQIALNAAIHGFPAKIFDISEKAMASLRPWAEKYIAGNVAKGKLTEEAAAEALKLFVTADSLEAAVTDADCVIEAITEDKELKRAFFKELDKCISADTIVATNSSFMVSSTFADCLTNPARLANMHYYNPALLMKFVEVVQGEHTASETAAALMDFCKKNGKRAIWQKKEIEGFAGNYIFAGLKERAYFLVQNGYCTYKDVDTAMEEGFRHPMGPFRTADFVGIDLCFNVMNAEYKATGVKPDLYDMFAEMVKEGRLGRKTGHGFYDYE